ncbi:P-loop containing nucleoside triphosphate hydrolase [Gracilaria domingensis]|nr:P-loop containing nucleoside triphosphate hydrolase [Gracilaria domingensis]
MDTRTVCWFDCTRTSCGDVPRRNFRRAPKNISSEIRVLVLGLDNAGKTTIMKRLKGEGVHSVSPTLGFDIKTLEFHKYKLNMWDVGRQQTIPTYWRNYFEQTDGIIWVVDSADVARLSDCRTELEKLLMEERFAGASLLVLANKQDLSGALTTEQIIEHLALNNMIGKKRHWQVFAY